MVLDRQFSIRLVTDDAPTAEGQMGAPGVLPPRDLMDEAGRISVLVRQARLNTLDTMLVVSFILVGILTIIAGAIGWLMAGQALQPLRDITATARRVADRSLHERIALAGPRDEIKDLADTLDAMLERLDRSFDSQRRFVANASHELRTPLTITRTLIEVALLEAGPDDNVRQLGTTLLAVNQRHERLTDGLLTLASSEQRAAEFHPSDLGEIAGHVVSELRPIADKAHVALETNLSPGAVLGDAFLLERLIRNLIENGIQYNVPDGGWVRVATTASAGHVELVVENTGPAVPAYEIPSLFEPFRRLAATTRVAGAARTPIVRGAGLGLSIVRSVAHSLLPAKLLAIDVVRLAAYGLKARPLRVVLSALGIAAMISVVGISTSSRAQLNQLLSPLGTNLLRAGPGTSMFGEASTMPPESVAMMAVSPRSRW